MKIILFDIDGTLLHTGGAGRIAFEIAFEELFHLPEAWGDLIPDGKTDPAIIEEICYRTLRRALTSPEYEKLCMRYHQIFHDEVQRSPRFRLMPGIPTLLENLEKRQEYLMGVATGNFEEAAWAKLKRGGLHKFFCFGGFGSDGITREALTRAAVDRGRLLAGRAISGSDILLIGDTIHDIRAGRTLGLRTLGVMTGQTTREEFISEKADAVLEDLSDAVAFERILKG